MKMVQESRIPNVQRPILVQPLSQTSLPKPDEHYFDKLAAFGIACLAAAIVGKAVLASLNRKK